MRYFVRKVQFKDVILFEVKSTRREEDRRDKVQFKDVILFEVKSTRREEDRRDRSPDANIHCARTLALVM